MSNRATSVGEMEQADDSKMKKLPPSTKQSLKHTTCLTGTTAIPSAFMSYSLQAAANSNLTDGKHHHHHHHHHHHGHHTSPHVIHRTTSESLRLGGDTSGGGGSPSFNNSTTMSGSSGTSSSSGHQPLMLNTSVARKPKTSSFQITSVTVGNKLSADNGEDSADDLDESHTDDNSRITDIENETPSFSEDTFSKEDVFFSNSALGTAPVIPTSSQYGLVIVDPELGGVGGQSGQNLSNVHVSVSDAGINIVGSPGGKLGDSDQKDMHYRNERFKVVKIESTEPFKRGRWMCMDYLDHSTLQTSENMQANTNNNTSSSNQTGTTTNDSGVVMAENHIDMNCDSSDPNGHYNTGVVAGGINMSNSPGQTLQHTISVVSLEHQHQQQLSNAVGGMPIGIHAQTMAHPSNVAAVNLQQPNIAGQSLPPSQIHQTIAGQHQSQPPPQVQSDYQQTGNHIPGQSQPAHFYINNQHNQSSAPNIHGATLPSNINMHNGVPSNFIPQVQQQSQVPTQPMSTVNMPMSNTAEQNPINTAPPMTSSNLAQTANSGHQPTVISQPTSMPQSTPQSQLCSEQFMPQSVAQSYPASALSVTSLPNNNTASGLSHDVHHVDVNSIQHTSVAGMVSSANVASNVLPQSISPAVDTMLQQSQPAQSPHQGIQTIPPLLQENVQPILLSDSASSVSTPQQSQVPSSVNLAPQQSVSNAEDDQPAAVEADSESASGTSAVAIDNKIEQAMDLVKSHLMIAVREEVEVLKEKIAELMDRINQLELENTILKANVSQETLSQLSATIQTASAKPSQNPNTSNGPVS